jgi:hypothetical protein
VSGSRFHDSTGCDDTSAVSMSTISNHTCFELKLYGDWIGAKLTKRGHPDPNLYGDNICPAQKENL